MNAKALADQLNTLLGTEIRSLARHIDEATPYVSPRSYKAFTLIRKASHISQDHGQRLVNLLDGMSVEPQPGGFQSDVASYHYMSVESLMPLLIQERESQIAAYQVALELAKGDVDTTQELQSLLTELQGLLEEFKALSHPTRTTAA